MITARIGQIFLDAYNSKYMRSFSAKDFFEQEYFELFFNHKKYMVWPQNSPFVQRVSSSKSGEYGIRETLKDIDGDTLKFDTSHDLQTYLEEKVHSREDLLELKNAGLKGIKILKTLNERERQQMLDAFYTKVEDSITNNDIDASVAIGYPASELKEYATTSGLVSNLDIKTNADEIYLSWIGSGLSVGVSGGLSILFDTEEILLKIYEGWKAYRKFLNDSSLQRLSGNKITSWNGQWLSYAFSDDFRDPFDFASLDNLGFFKTDKTATAIQTIKWSKLFFNLSKKFPDKTLMGYVFSFGQMNKTLGFYPFRFSEARKPIILYKKLFGESAVINDASKYELLFGLKFREACKLGAIGIQALRPESLFEDIRNNKKLGLIKYRTYKIWLLAMINKGEMLEFTSELSEILHLFRDSSKGTDRKALIEKELFQSGKRNFLIKWEEIVKAPPVPKSKLKEISDKIYFMSNEDYGYFIALLKLDYRYQETD